MEREKTVVQALEQWVTGSGYRGNRQFYVENGANVEAVTSRMGPADVAFVPAGFDQANSPLRLIAYDGALSAPGDQFFLAGQVVEVQEYLASGFVEVFGPTVVHLGGEDGWTALAEDAETARKLGVFPEHLLNPGILLADRIPLLDLAAESLSSRFHVRADESVTCGTQGKWLGSTVTTDLVTAAPAGAVDAVSGVVSPEVLAADAGRFASVGRFIGALDLLRALKETPSDFPIVGFGLSLIEDDLANATPHGFEPFLGHKGDEFLLINPKTRARHRVGPETALLVEMMQTSSTLEMAAERARKHFSVSHEQVLVVFEQIDRNLQVRTPDADTAGIAQ